MHAERRQAYEKEMHAAAEHYSGNNLDRAFHHLERALVDAEGRLETPRPNRGKRPNCQNNWGIALLANLGAGGEYRWCACSFF
jgi:hypothetical protein